MNLKKFVILIWIIFILCWIIFYLIFPYLFTAKNIVLNLKKFNKTIIIVYFIICLLRGFTLVPSTPFVIAGVMILPQNLFCVLFISISSIAFSSTLIYYFSNYLGFDVFLNSKYPKQVQNLKIQLNKKRGMYFVFVWSFLPFFPTDLICYIGGILKIKFSKFILSLLLGEFIICLILIFFSEYLVRII